MKTQHKLPITLSLKAENFPRCIIVIYLGLAEQFVTCQRRSLLLFNPPQFNRSSCSLVLCKQLFCLQSFNLSSGIQALDLLVTMWLHRPRSHQHVQFNVSSLCQIAFHFGTQLKCVFPLKWNDTTIIKCEPSHKHLTSEKWRIREKRKRLSDYEPECT